jgi:hypothetical protein
MFHPLPHGVAGPYDELICFGSLIVFGLLYLGLYVAAGRRSKSKKDQQSQPSRPES